VPQPFTLQSAVPPVRPEIQSPLFSPHFSLVETVTLLLSHRAISPNAIHPPASGTTALHLAASLGRADVANLLLEQDEIDDTLKDSSGKTCIDVARGKDVLSVINGAFILMLPILRLTFQSLVFRLKITSYCILQIPTAHLHSISAKHPTITDAYRRPLFPACPVS
jgi:oxysterol-binding protein 1